MSDSSGAATPTRNRSSQHSTPIDPIETLVSDFEAISVVTPVPTTEPRVTPMNPTLQMAPNVGGVVFSPWMKEIPKLARRNGMAFIEDYTAYAESRGWDAQKMLANLAKHTTRDIRTTVEYLVTECTDWESAVAAIEEEFEEAPLSKKEKQACEEWEALVETGLDVADYKFDMRKFEAIQTTLRGKPVSGLGKDLSLGQALLQFCRADLRAKIKRKLGENAPTYERVKQNLLVLAPRMKSDLTASEAVEKKEKKESTEGLVSDLLEEIRQMRQEMQQAGTRGATATVPSRGGSGGFVGSCLYCDKPGHTKNFCQDMKDAEEKGWIKVVDGCASFADNSRLPLNKGQGGMKASVEARFVNNGGGEPAQVAARHVRVTAEPRITHTYHAHLELAPEVEASDQDSISAIPIVGSKAEIAEVNALKRRRANDARVIEEEEEEVREMVDEATSTDKRKPAQFHCRSQADMEFDPKILLESVYNVTVPVPLRALVAAAPSVHKGLHDLTVKHRVPINGMDEDAPARQDMPTPNSMSSSPGPSGTSHVQVRTNSVVLSAPVTHVRANVGGKDTEILIDSGSEANLMSEAFFKSLPNVILGEDSARTWSVVAYGGQKLPALGVVQYETKLSECF